MRRDLEALRQAVQAKAKTMSPAARERQLVSLAYGNLKLEDDRTTRSAVEAAARRLAKKP